MEYIIIKKLSLYKKARFFLFYEFITDSTKH